MYDVPMYIRCTMYYVQGTTKKKEVGDNSTGTLEGMREYDILRVRVLCTCMYVRRAYLACART